MPDAARAPDLGGVGGWIGVTRPPTMAALRGRVVLVAFWAASDVESHRLLDDLRPLEDLFADQLVVVAVHSPRFPHEAEHDAVVAAAARHSVAHAVVDDADHRVWEAYGVAEWPTVVVVDPTNRVFGYVSGKGCGAALEKVVAEVLAEMPSAGSRRRRLPTVARALLPSGPLAFPGKVAVSPDGRRLAVSDTAHDRVLVCSLAGVVLEVHTGYLRPQGVRFDGPDVVICDTGADRLVRTGGEVLADAVSAPWDVAADGPSWLIAEAGGHRVLRLRPGELRVRLVAGTGQEGPTDGPVQKATLSQPSGVARIPAGVVVADAGTGRLRLVTDGAGAEVVTLAGGPGPDGLQLPLGVTADPAAARVYVADTYNSALRVWDGTTLRTLPVGGLKQPGGLDVLPDGRLVVADTGNHRIVLVDPASGRLEPVDLDETWVHGDDGPPLHLAPGRAGEVTFGIDLVDEALDPGAEDTPVQVMVEARPAALLAGGPVRLGLDRPSGAVEVRGGSPGSGLLLVEVMARTVGAGGPATRVHRRRHQFEVGGEVR